MSILPRIFVWFYIYDIDNCYLEIGEKSLTDNYDRIILKKVVLKQVLSLAEIFVLA